MSKPNKNALFAPISPRAVKRLRRELKTNQADFWATVGVTQSGGSRYESGREIPKPVRALVRIVHIWKLTPNVLRYIGGMVNPGYALAAMAAGSKTLKLIRSKNKKR
ncbi:MAG: transcriptional regulator [Patescibacteria group bacterium]